MEAQVAKKEKSEVVIDFVIPAAEVEKGLAASAKVLSKEMKFDGFRAGHVPVNVVEQKIGREALWEHAAEQSIAPAYAKVVKENDLEPIGRPEVQVKKLAPDNDFEFSLSVAVLPAFDLPEYKNLETEKREVKVEDEEVDKVLQSLADMRADFHNVDREAKEGDRIEMDLVVKMDGKVIEDGESRSLPLVIGEVSLSLALRSR